MAPEYEYGYHGRVECYIGIPIIIVDSIYLAVAWGQKLSDSAGKQSALRGVLEIF